MIAKVRFIPPAAGTGCVAGGFSGAADVVVGCVVAAAVAVVGASVDDVAAVVVVTGAGCDLG